MPDPTNPEVLARLHASLPEAASVDVEVLVTAATHALRSQAIDDAHALVQAALVLSPDHPRAWALSGEVAEAQGRVDEAVRAYELALSLDADDGALALNLATLYVRRADKDKAIALLTWLLSTDLDEAVELRQRAEALLVSAEALS